MPSSRSVHLILALLIPPWTGAAAACSGSSASDQSDGSAQTGDSGQQPSPDGSTADGGTTDSATDGSSANDGPSDGGAQSSDGSLPFTCTAPPSPNPCPAPTGADNQASFCFRPRWAGATKVEVYLSKTGQQSDWSSPFTTLTS